jgi:phosphoglycerate dehydrogenase-like enzyme
MSEIQVLVTVPFPDDMMDRLQDVSPRLSFHQSTARRPDDLPASLLPQIEILYTLSALPLPEQAPRLRWVQMHYAGVDHVVDHPLVRAGVAVTTMSGAAAPQVAEFAWMAILALARQLPEMLRDQAGRHWDDDRFHRFRPVEVRGATIGIVGYGSIGREVGRLARAFGASVLAVKRDLMRLDDDGYRLGGVGDPDATQVDRLYPPQAVASMAERCDFLVVTAPLTPETRGLIGRAVFQRMKPTAYLIDISRGQVVDQDALIQALRDRHLAGAALDVYPVEPLPADSPLWEMPNVILSPHVAGASGAYYERAAAVFAENLRRYLADQPLLNRFDPRRGY